MSAKALARRIGVKSVSMCSPEVAHRHSGYLVGGTSPFGTRKAMPVYMERTILDLPRVYVNGGSRGFPVALDPREMERVLAPELVEVGMAPDGAALTVRVWPSRRVSAQCRKPPALSTTGETGCRPASLAGAPAELRSRLPAC